MTIIEKTSQDFDCPSKYVTVLGDKIHYFEIGEGTPILFLHGAPTSSYVWRNIFPHLSGLGRCIAPDLIGYGQSGKPDIAYNIADHIKYIEQFIEALDLHSVVLVMHGLGSVIGLDYAMRHEKNCKGLVFYEAFLRSESVEDLSLPYLEQLNAWKDEKDLNTNLINKLLQQLTMHDFTEEELKHYRQPFLQPNTLKPLLQFLNELPRGDKKGPLDAIIKQYSSKLCQSKIPKLLLYSIPGLITTMATVMWAKENFANLEVAELGEELHLAQESNAELFGETVSVWLQGIEQL